MYCSNEALNCLFSKIKSDDAVDRYKLQQYFCFLIMLFSELKENHFRVTYVNLKGVNFLHCWAGLSPKRSGKSFL